MKIAKRILAASAALLISAGAAHAAEWTEDYAAAAAQAKKEHKMLLLDFTGSDWCVWCKRTDKEVFDTAKFREFADKKLVLVKVDFPKERPMPDAVKAQNAKLQEKYGIEGYPTLIVLSPSEKVVFSQVGYKEGGPDAFIAEFPAGK
ncbi:MAG TPA: thioredoxin family protein [Opitutaceae bacterium]|jgi:protein disulfide-isomerase